MRECRWKYFASKKGDNYLKFSLSLALRLQKNLADPPDWIVPVHGQRFCAVLIRIFSLKPELHFIIMDGRESIPDREAAAKEDNYQPTG